MEWKAAGANDFSSTWILVILISCVQGSFEEQEKTVLFNTCMNIPFH